MKLFDWHKQYVRVVDETHHEYTTIGLVEKINPRNRDLTVSVGGGVRKFTVKPEQVQPHQGDHNMACRRAEHEISYSAKRAAELFFSAYDRSRGERDWWFHPTALQKACEYHCLKPAQCERLKAILIECGFQGLIEAQPTAEAPNQPVTENGKTQ